jgi:hypothetical protein
VAHRGGRDDAERIGELRLAEVRDLLQARPTRTSGAYVRSGTIGGQGSRTEGGGSALIMSVSDLVVPGRVPRLPRRFLCQSRDRVCRER